jgi:Trypsin
MGVSLGQAEEMVEAAAAELFDADPSVRSVGVTQHGSGYGFRAVQNSSVIVPFVTGEPFPLNFQGIPITVTSTPGEVESLVAVPSSGPASPSAASVIPEVNRHRPLVCGLQIQNFDDDQRQGVLDQGFIIIGTLGCFVRLSNGSPGFVSNNHVVAGENRGLVGTDRILQPGSGAFNSADQIGLLRDFVKLLVSPLGATPKKGTAILNDVDAGLVELDEGVSFTQGYLPSRSLIAPNAVAKAKVGDKVFKVGRTTGLTFGEVKDVATIVGPVAYDPGPCWFRRSIVIEGLNGTLFSDKGDSGSAIVRTNGEVVGLLYAGNGQQTYACPMDTVLTSFSCTLA